MATFREIMDAAQRADAAGDAQAAGRLVEIARGMLPAEQPQPQQPDQPILPRADYSPGNVRDASAPEVDKFGDTIREATADPIAATKFFAGRTVEEGRAPWQRVGDAAMTGLSAAGATYAAGAGLVSEVLGGSPTQERKMARDLMMAGEVAAPELAGVSSTARAGGTAARRVQQVAEKPVTDTMRTARAADDLGITPAFGSSGKVAAQTAAGLEKVPFTGDVIARDAARFVDEIETAYAGAVGRIGEARNAEGAGSTLKSGVDRFVVGFKEQSGKMYDAVGEKIAKDSRSMPSNTITAIREAAEAFADNPEIRSQLGLDRWIKLADDMEQSGVSWQAMKSLRTNIGESAAKASGPLKDQSKGMLDRIYGSLTDDMAAAAEAAGPDAKRAWDRANSYYAAGAKRIEQALDRTIKADSPERAFEAFTAMAKGDRSTSNIRRMQQIKRSLSDDEWSTVSASIIDRLGKAPAGGQNAAGDVFSPSHFLTEWNKISPEAKSILLPRAARKEMEKLADVAAGAKRINVERNFSNTGNALGMIAALFGSSVSLPATAGALGTANLSARAFTSTRFLRAMNQMARGDDRAMKALSRSDSPYAMDATTILRMSAADAAGGPSANTNETPMYQRGVMQ